MKDFDKKISDKGWALFPGIVKQAEVDEIRGALDKIQEKQKQVQKKNGVDMPGVIHCILGYEKAIDDFLASLPVQEYVSHYFGKPYILNNFGGVINTPSNKAYVNKPHRDVRDFTHPLRLMINMLVMIDDFTLENGATMVVEGSHKELKPDEKETFIEKSIQLTGKAGDVILWDSNLLHATGHNKTDKTRRALTICYSRPYIKPTIDFLTALPPGFVDKQPSHVQKLLGAEARAAKNLDEFLQPPENWTFKMN